MKKLDGHSGLKIAVVLNASWNVFNFRMGLLRALENEGHRIFVIAPFDAYSKRLGFPYFPVDLEKRGRNPFRDVAFLIQLCRIFRKQRPDVALLFTPKPNIYGAVAAAWMGVPSISNIAGLGTLFTNTSWTTRLIYFMYRFALRFPSKIFFQNSEDKDLFLNSRLVPPEKVECLPGSGVDTKRFQPKGFSSQEKSTTFLLASRLLREKGVVEFVAAARIIKCEGLAANFQLLGFLDPQNADSITSEELRKWSDEGLIHYLGVTDQIETYMNQADCIVLPTYYREGVPRVLLEAAALGKPIIASNNVGCNSIVQHGSNGLLCRPRDLFDLADKIRDFIALPVEARVAMGHRGREKAVKEFDEQHVIDQYLKALEGVMEQEK